MALCIDARIGVSKIHGIGLLAFEDIPKGTLVWKFNELIDLYLSEEQIQQLPKPAISQMLNYAFLDANNGLYVLCGDDARFMNHADMPNCIAGIDGHVGCTVAAKDIVQGEELTENYYSFDSSASRKLKN